jgi:hypothetical protein
VLPHHLLFLAYLWTQRAGRWGVLLLFAAPLAALPGFLADTPALRLFGGAAAVAAVLQYFAMKHVRGAALKVI